MWQDATAEVYSLRKSENRALEKVMNLFIIYGVLWIYATTMHGVYCSICFMSNCWGKVEMIFPWYFNFWTYNYNNWRTIWSLIDISIDWDASFEMFA